MNQCVDLFTEALSQVFTQSFITQPHLHTTSVVVASPAAPLTGLYDSYYTRVSGYDSRVSGQDSSLAWVSDSKSDTCDSVSSDSNMTDVSDAEMVRRPNATTDVNQISDDTMANLASQTTTDNSTDGSPKSIAEALDRLGQQMKQEIEVSNKRIAGANKKELLAKIRALSDENETLKRTAKEKVELKKKVAKLKTEVQDIKKEESLTKLEVKHCNQ